jgi:predicted glycosyltransferase
MRTSKRANGRTGVRIALYSHDGMGLGHIRRNLLIAQSLIAHRSESDVLLIAGAHEASVLSSEVGIDCLTVPRLCKDADGSYAPRSMNLDLATLLEVRSQAIGGALRAFDPDLFIVDKKPRGANGELDTVLQDLRARGRTKTVLGFRDVLDAPEAVGREWDDGNYSAAIRDFYDAVWVYGDRNVHDLAAGARLPESVGRRLEYTGYFDKRARLAHTGKSARGLLAETGVNDDPFVLCMVGGGEDGMQLAENFARAELPRGMHGIIVTGPFMPASFRSTLFDLAGKRPGLHVLEFVNEPTVLIAAAERVISMGGYCAFTEAVSFEKPALIVPRVEPRSEQLIRAQRFAELGLVDYLTPDRLSPTALARWMAEDTSVGKGARSRIDIGGTDRLPRMVDALLRGGRPPGEEPGSAAAPPRVVAERREMEGRPGANLLPTKKL